MTEDFLNSIYRSHLECPDCPGQEKVTILFEDLLGTLFPYFSRMSFNSPHDVGLHLNELEIQLAQMIMKSAGDENEDTKLKAKAFIEKLPDLQVRLTQDVEAMYNGDPAAQNKSEVIRSYPGFYAIAAYRIAHELLKMEVPVLPRIITESAHSRTGIDIHPAAQIGSYFCIDHGTGVVIGETAIIGNQVKIYQGVTLGALSVSKKQASTKRHPTIADNVTIYAGATILGGKTVVGENSIIGGNVWLTKSVPANTRVYYKATMHDENTGNTDTVIYKTHS